MAVVIIIMGSSFIMKCHYTRLREATGFLSGVKIFFLRQAIMSFHKLAQINKLFMRALMCQHLFYILKQITYDLLKYN